MICSKPDHWAAASPETGAAEATGVISGGISIALEKARIVAAGFLRCDSVYGQVTWRAVDPFLEVSRHS